MRPRGEERVPFEPFREWLCEAVERYESPEQAAGAMGIGGSQLRRWLKGEVGSADGTISLAVVDHILTHTGSSTLLAELYPPAEGDDGDHHAWCPACREDVPIMNGLCLWCDAQTEAVLVNRFRQASGRGHHDATRICTWTETPEQRRRRYEKIAAANRKIDDDTLAIAVRLYQEEGLTMRQVAERLFDGVPHMKVERFEEGLRRLFRSRGYAMRTTAESLSGRLCRTQKRCAAHNNRGRRCGGNVVRRPDGSYGDYCWQHDESFSKRREALSHLERMRKRRRWTSELVPIAPLIEWANRRSVELAGELDPGRGRYDGRGGWAELARRTGVACSTWGKWRQGKSTQGKPKSTITESKVREILEREGTTTFAEIYGAIDRVEYREAA